MAGNQRRFSIENNDTNPCVELTLKYRFTRGGCPKTYIHMFKLTLNPCRTLGS